MYFLLQLEQRLQNGSAHEVGASYSGLHEEGEVEHIKSNFLRQGHYRCMPIKVLMMVFDVTRK